MLSNHSRSAFMSQFAGVPKADIPRSSFNRSFKHTTAIWDDLITPIHLEEIYPGDTINIGVNSFVRMNPTITPIMDNIWMDIHYFFVPHRLVWDNFQKFMGEQIDPGDSIDYLVPQMNTPTVAGVPTGYPLGSIGDYFGLPLLVDDMETVSALPFRGYNLIYNQWYRDQNLRDSLSVPRNDGPDTFATNTYPVFPEYRNKRHDYFTSCLPWPQKGPAVTIPTSSTVPVYGSGSDLRLQSSVTSTAKIVPNVNTGTGNLQYSTIVGGFANGDTVQVDTATSSMHADLSANTEATINALREAFQLQKFLERDARGGTRYTELLRSHFGVTSDDARLQRPEFLGGSSHNINMHALAQTSEDGTTPQGNLSGNGTMIGTNTRIIKSFTEHGYVFGFVSFRGDVSYSQGIDRHFSRQTRYDFYWPEFAHLGEQAVLNKELHAQGSGVGTDDDVFGYIGRYDELRFSKSRVTNIMRPNASGSLASWNLSPELSGTPVLNSTFITSQTPLDRVLSVPSEPAFLADFYFDFKHARPMPTYGVPGWSDHF